MSGSKITSMPQDEIRAAHDRGKRAWSSGFRWKRHADDRDKQNLIRLSGAFDLNLPGFRFRADPISARAASVPLFESPQPEGWGFLDTMRGTFGACYAMSR